MTLEEAVEMKQAMSEAAANINGAWDKMTEQEKEVTRRMVWELVFNLRRELRFEIHEAINAATQKEGQ